MALGADGLKCWKCPPEDNPDDKCTYDREGKDGESWYGQNITCDAEQDHCMVSRTGKIITGLYSAVFSKKQVHRCTNCKFFISNTR